MRATTWRRRATLLILALAAAAATSFESVPLLADNARWGANYFPNVTLTTHEGKPVRFYDDLIRGKIVAIDLIYTTCKYACPLETARLAQVQTLLGDRMGKDVFFYSITIAPEHDTPPVLKEYAEKFHAGPGWLFLTGKADDIELISKKLGLYTEPNPANKDGHTPSLLVGNEETGQWMRNSALDNPRFLARTIGDWLNSWKTAKRGVSFAAAPAALEIDPGRYGFATHCAPCHTLGGGPRIGPDLAGVTRARDRAWLTRFIVSPATMVAEGDPTAVALFERYKPIQMPNLSLGAADARAIIDYIEAESVAAEAKRAAAAPAPAGAAALDPTPFLAPYLAIQQALSADSLGGVAESARALAARAVAAGVAGDRIGEAAAMLQQATSLAVARDGFAQIGDVLLAAMHDSGAAREGLRIAYCPMARKYWLQKGDEIRNPFYGKQMLDCGRFVSQPADPKERAAARGPG